MSDASASPDTVVVDATARATAVVRDHLARIDPRGALDGSNRGTDLRDARRVVAGMLRLCLAMGAQGPPHVDAAFARCKDVAVWLDACGCRAPVAAMLKGLLRQAKPAEDVMQEGDGDF
jgi:hypothetical protein